MATTLSAPIKLSYGTWKYTWTGTAPFRVFNYDTYTFVLRDTETTSLVVTSGNDIEPPAIAVYDSTEDALIPEGVKNPAQIILQWRGYKYAQKYSIQKETSPSVYETVQEYQEDGRGYYKFISTVAADTISATNYKVVMTDKSGAEKATTIAQLLIRNPAPPLLTYTYNELTGNLTIGAA